MTGTKYFNVPIPMLRGLLTGEKKVRDFTQSAITYSLYRHAKYLPYSEDDDSLWENDFSTQIKAAASFLNVKIGNIDREIKEGERLLNLYGENVAFCGINTDILWD